MGSLSVKHAFLFGLSVESLKMENLISDQNQVELDVILQNQFFFRGQNIFISDTLMQFSELHQIRQWPFTSFEYKCECIG